MSNRKKLDPRDPRASVHHQDHGRYRDSATTLSGFAAKPGHAGAKILAAGVLGSAAMMALHAGAAAAALAEARAGAPATAPATLTAALMSPFNQLSVSTAPADQTAAGLFQGLLNSQPVSLPGQGGDFTTSASGASQNFFPFNALGVENPKVNPLENLVNPPSDQALFPQGGNQVQLAQLVPDQNSPTIPGTDIHINQTIEPGGFIPSGNGITVTGPGGISVLTDSNGNAQVTIAAGMGPNGPEPAATFTLPPNGEIHLGSGDLNVPSNAGIVSLPPGVYKVGDPPPSGQPDQRPSIIVDPPQPPASPSQPGPTSEGGTSGGQPAAAPASGSNTAAQTDTPAAPSDSGTIQTAGQEGAGATTSTGDTDIMTAGDPTDFGTPSA